jgi:hypothetical protein
MSTQSATQNVGVPPATDYDAIAAVIQLYIDGLNEADADKLRACFHKNAWAAWTTEEDGSLVQHPVQDVLDDWTSESMPEGGWTHRILSLTQAGDVASVLLEMHTAEDSPGMGWVDIHALLRIDGVWKDMNKTATHVSRAGWANTVHGW